MQSHLFRSAEHTAALAAVHTNRDESMSMSADARSTPPAAARPVSNATTETIRLVQEIGQKVKTANAVLIIGYSRRNDDKFATETFRDDKTIFSLDIDDDDHTHPRVFKFDFGNITDESFEAVRDTLRPVFTEIVFEWSTFNFVLSANTSAILHFFGRLLTEQGRLLIIGPTRGMQNMKKVSELYTKSLSFALNTDEQAKLDDHFAMLREQARTEIMFAAGVYPKNPESSTPESEFRSAKFVDKRKDAGSPIVNMLAERQAIRLQNGPDTKKETFYGNIFVATRKSDFERRRDSLFCVCADARKLEAAYLVVGIRPGGHDADEAPEVVINDDQVFSMSDEQTPYTVRGRDSEAALRANRRFAHFDFNEANSIMMSESRLIAECFDEIMFDWSVYKFVQIDRERAVIRLFFTMLKPGGRLLLPLNEYYGDALILRERHRKRRDDESYSDYIKSIREDETADSYANLTGHLTAIFGAGSFEQVAHTATNSEIYNRLIAKNERRNIPVEKLVTIAVKQPASLV